MTRLLHLSDLHFGRTSHHLLDPLIGLAEHLRPDLTVISGDLTQRARNWQFAEAKAFVARLPGPVLSVPGNHDVPLDNLFMRVFAPWIRYRRHISADLEPIHEDEAMIVVGVNTVNRWVWQQGALTDADVTRLGRLFAKAEGRTCIAVMHHPIEQLPEWNKTLMRGATTSIAPLRAAGTQIVLSGHIHLTHVAPATANPGLLLVQAGTGLSDRLRNVENSVNLLTIEPGHVTVETWGAGAEGVFRSAATARFHVADDVWRVPAPM